MAAMEYGDPAAFRELLEPFGITAQLFSCPWNGSPNASVPDVTWRSRLAALPHLFSHIRACGAQAVSLFFNAEPLGMVALAAGELAARLGEIADVAQAHGLSVCVELNDAHHLRDAAEILDRADRGGGGVELLLDLFHVYRSGLDAGWIARLPICSIGWIHLSDVPLGLNPCDCEASVRCAPGTGQLDLVALLSAVARNGYHGPLSVEVLEQTLRREPPLERAQRLLRAAREVMNKVQA